MTAALPGAAGALAGYRRHRDLVWVTLAALAVRLWWNLSIHPPLAYAFSDMGGYLERAQTSIDAPGVPHPHFVFFPWGTHWLLSLIKRAFGRDNGAAIGVVYAVLGALAVAYGHALARRFTRRSRVALAVGAALVVYYPWISLGGYTLSEPPFTLFLCGAAFHGLAYADRGRARDAWLLGGMLAAGALFRPQILAALPLYAVHALVRRGTWRRRLPERSSGSRALRRLLPALVVPLALVSVVSAARAHFHTGRYGFIAQNGPLNFAFGRCHATSITAIAPDRRSGYAPPPLGALAAYEASHAGTWFALDPARERDITVSGHIWDAEPFQALASDCVARTGTARQIRYAVTHLGLLWFHDPMWPDSGQPAFALVGGLAQGAHNLLVLPGALLAIGLAFRRRYARAMLLGLYPVSLMIVAMVYFGDTRLRAPYDGIAIVLAASVYAAAPGAIRRARAATRGR